MATRDVRSALASLRARLASRLERLSVRQRFLVEPLLGLVLLAALTTAFVLEIQHQNALLKRIADENLAAYDRYSEVFVDLSEQHLALHDLLNSAQTLDEMSLYDAAKARLNEVHRAVRELDRALPDACHDGNLLPLRVALVERMQAYRKAVTSAVDLATLNRALAAGRLAHVNERFSAMNRAFVQFLDAERHGIMTDIALRAHRGEVDTAVIVVSGAAAAGLLIALSFLLSRLLARALEKQIRALTALGDQAGTAIPTGGVNEIQGIAQAIVVFRESLSKLRDNEQTLASTNRALKTALDEVGRARDELEVRVSARTQALREANDAMRNEIELRKEAERHLTIYAEIIRSTGEAVAITDPDVRIIEVNPAYEAAVRRSRDELLGTALYAADGEDEAAATYRELWDAVKTDGHWTGEVLDRRSNGESFPTWALLNAVRDEHGATTHYVCVSRDITALKQSEQQLQKLAFYDALTQLPNRALFNDRLRVAGERRARSHARSGHVSQSRRLSRMSVDTLARTGGDEFTILLTHPETEAAAVAVAERIVEVASKAIRLGNRTVYVGASVGLSFYPKDGTDAETLQMKADMAMYESKQGGRGQCRVFTGEMIGRSHDRISLSSRLEVALANDEFKLFYQPIVDSSTGAVDRVEALIRWHPPGGAPMLPEDFIRHAESSGLIKRIDAWVLERACRDAMSWLQRDGRELSVCVNLSAVSMQQSNMAEIVADILERTKLPPRLLNLEITETAVIADPYAARRVLGEIVSLGVGTSLDDFGTGYSSLSYLTRFPINCIKLDCAFVDRIGKDRASEEVIKSLLELAAKLKLRVVAEGVEQQLQQDFLSEVGCDLMQGYHFVHPMTIATLRDWLAAHDPTRSVDALA